MSMSSIARDRDTCEVLSLVLVAQGVAVVHFPFSPESLRHLSSASQDVPAEAV